MLKELSPGTELSESEPVSTVRDTTADSFALAYVLEELTEEEAALRHRLELRVEQAFYSAGRALRELRDLRLYRSTHKSWDAYCKDKFGFGRDSADLKILAAAVVEEIEQLPTIRRQILPTTLEQIRPLTKLQMSSDRTKAWEQAVEEAGGKVPSGRIVKGIVERLRQRDTTPPLIPYQEGDVVMIRSLGNSNLRKHDGQWAIALESNEYTVTVSLNGKDIPVEPQFLKQVDPKYWTEIKSINDRISRLQQLELDVVDDAVLKVLRRQTFFTDRQYAVLTRLEKDYSIEIQPTP